MTQETIQKKLLEKIVNSAEFSHSKIYQNYLTYLVESTNANKQLKEITIAMEVFGKDSRFNPSEDTIVRSHTYTLRKKLESYYFHEGKEDKYRLKIPKGHYETKFEPVSENLCQSSIFSKSLLKPAFYIIITLLCIVIGMLFNQNHQIRQKIKKYQIVDPEDPIWKEFLVPEKPALIIIGDHFFFNEYSNRYEEFLGMRHPHVNSYEDLEQYRIEHPGIKLEVASEPYFPYHAIWGLPDVLELFYSVHKKPILRKASDVSPQILDEYNIIFIGSIKTLYKLKHTFLRSHFDFNIAPHRIIYTPPESDEKQIFETTLHSPGVNEDLVLALKLPGPDNNAILIIASFHSLGAPEIVNFMTDPAQKTQLDAAFHENLNKIPKYFEILFRVTGIDKTAYDTEILILNEIDINE